MELLQGPLGALLLTGLALVGLVGGMLSLRGRSDPVLRRLLSPARSTAPSPLLASSSTPEYAERPRAGALARGLEAIVDAARGDEGNASALRTRLVQAGLRSPSAARVFLLAKLGMALGLPLAFLMVNSVLTDPVRMAVPVAIWLCAGGFFLPNLWVGSKVSSRRSVIERGLPDALDLLVTCVEAGLGLDAALLRVAGDLQLSWPQLSEELNLTFLEIKAGIGRTDAFRRLFERTGVDELKSLAATLAQAEMFGTSIALSLRVQASAIRVRRMHRAEERAGMVSVKMTVPLVLCILPSLLAVVMGPAAVNIYHSLVQKL